MIKRAFTMIELIFVIVILGILAVVALPRLSTTRDDAEITSLASNLSRIITDCSSYYISQDKYEEDISKMSDVHIINRGKFTAQLPIKNTACLQINLYGQNESNITAGTIEVVAINKTEDICNIVHNTSIIDNYIKQGKYLVIGKSIIP